MDTALGRATLSECPERAHSTARPWAQDTSVSDADVGSAHAARWFSLQEPRDAQHTLYVFHPSLPGILLELANFSANIVAFQGECASRGLGLRLPSARLWLLPSALTAVSPVAVLFEPSRHAACVLLMGPASPDAPGTVSVAKHKVRDLVPSGRVVRLAEGGPDSDQAVRDRFSRLRYRSEA